MAAGNWLESSLSPPADSVGLHLQGDELTAALQGIHALVLAERTEYSKTLRYQRQTLQTGWENILAEAHNIYRRESSERTPDAPQP